MVVSRRGRIRLAAIGAFLLLLAGVLPTGLALGPGVAHAAEPAGVWWNGAWNYRKAITVTAPAGTALETGYSVKLTVDHAALVAAGKSLASGADLRVVYWTGSGHVELDRVLAAGSAWNSATTILWFKTQAAIASGGSTNNYSLYYGQPSAGVAPANPDSVFLLWDDFASGSINPAKWTTSTSGTVTVAVVSGELRISGTTSTADQSATFGLISAGTFGGGISIASTFSIASQSPTARKHWKALIGLNSACADGLALDSSNNTDKKVRCLDGSTWSTVADSGLDGITFTNQAIQQTRVADGTGKHYEGGVLKATKTGLSTAAQPVRFQYGPDRASETFEARFDSIVVRKYVAADASITVTAGGEAQPPTATGAVTYLYDPLGRLAAVVDAASDVAIYRYDAVGNLTEVVRHPAAEVDIIVAPPGGTAGSPITIAGTGFSTTPSQNTVTFNGIAGTVVSATATQLVVTVPAGATTGPLTVTTPTGSATGSTPFTVTASGGAPTITSFTPTIGTPGTPVTITGTNFETTLSNNNVTFNIARAAVSSGTATTIATNAPVGTSGRISVATPRGKAVSAADYFIPPSPYTAADVEATGRIAFGEDRTVTIATANKIGLIVFDGTAQQWINLGISAVTGLSTDCWYNTFVSINTPDGAPLASVQVGTCGGDIDVQLPVSGTYTIVVKAGIGRVGSATLSLSTPIAGPLVAGGASVTASLRPGQDTRLTFSGTAGQWVNVAISGVSGLSTDCWYNTLLSIVKPDGTSLASVQVGTCGGDLDVQLPVNGTYAVVVDALYGWSGSATLTLSYPITGTLSPTAPGTAVTLRLGQDTRLTFSGTAGQWVNVAIGDVAGLSTDCWYNTLLSIIKPDGTSLASVEVGTCGGELDVQVPVSGTYTVVVDTTSPRTGSATVTFSEPITGTLNPTDPGTAMTLRPGQDARLTFSGAAGQWANLGIVTGLSTDCWYNTVVSILKPDGTTLAAVEVGTCHGDLDVLLPVSGTYTALLDTTWPRAGSATLTLSNPVTGTMSIGGPSVSPTLRSGQDARLTFEGSSGQAVRLTITGVTELGVDCWSAVAVYILKPDGTTQASFTVGTCGGTLNTTLTVSGTHTILVDAGGGEAGSLTLTLSNQ